MIKKIISAISEAPLLKFTNKPIKEAVTNKKNCIVQKWAKNLLNLLLLSPIMNLKSHRYIFFIKLNEFEIASLNITKTSSPKSDISIGYLK